MFPGIAHGARRGKTATENVFLVTYLDKLPKVLRYTFPGHVNWRQRTGGLPFLWSKLMKKG